MSKIEPRIWIISYCGCQARRPYDCHTQQLHYQFPLRKWRRPSINWHSKICHRVRGIGWLAHWSVDLLSTQPLSLKAWAFSPLNHVIPWAKGNFSTGLQKNLHLHDPSFLSSAQCCSSSLLCVENIYTWPELFCPVGCEINLIGGPSALKEGGWKSPWRKLQILV